MEEDDKEPWQADGSVLREEPDVRVPFDLEERTSLFGEAIIDFCVEIPLGPRTNRLVDQITGCGTSIGANYGEADDALSKKDFAKTIGLAKFAEKHWHIFDRIKLIRKKRAPDGKDRYFRLDVGKESVRKKVLQLISNAQLDQVFEEEAKMR